MKYEHFQIIWYHNLYFQAGIVVNNNVLVNLVPENSRCRLQTKQEWDSDTYICDSKCSERPLYCDRLVIVLSFFFFYCKGKEIPLCLFWILLIFKGYYCKVWFSASTVFARWFVPGQTKLTKTFISYTAIFFFSHTLALTNVENFTIYTPWPFNCKSLTKKIRKFWTFTRWSLLIWINCGTQAVYWVLIRMVIGAGLE